MNAGQKATLDTVSAQLRSDFVFHQHFVGMITKAVLDEMNITKGDFVTYTPDEALRMANRAAHRFLNQLTQKP